MFDSSDPDVTQDERTTDPPQASTSTALPTPEPAAARARGTEGEEEANLKAPKDKDGKDLDLSKAWTVKEALSHPQVYDLAQLTYIYFNLDKVGKGAPTALKGFVKENDCMMPMFDLKYKIQSDIKSAVNAGTGAPLSAMFGQASADRTAHTDKCGECAKEKGKFSECVTAVVNKAGDPYLKGACMNCMMGGSATDCSLSDAFGISQRDSSKAGKKDKTASSTAATASTPAPATPIVSAMALHSLTRTGRHLRIPLTANSNYETADGLLSLMGDIAAYHSGLLATVRSLNATGIEALGKQKDFRIRADVNAQAMGGKKSVGHDGGATRGKKRRRERDEDDSEEDRKPSMAEMTEGFRRMEKKITKLQEDMAAMRG
ncbi:unnamed protein product [Zymoseptoria tritici ST99CH_3D1]|nr:unnamed protein product [Zymoseptoria tritici ST99CH_3D1]